MEFFQGFIKNIILFFSFQYENNKIKSDASIRSTVVSDNLLTCLQLL